jgi:hypothetical protein
VRGTELIVQESGGERRAPITTLGAAAELVGADKLPEDLLLDSEPLAIEAEAAAFLGDWYGFAASVLEELRAQAGEALEPSRTYRELVAAEDQREEAVAFFRARLTALTG